MENPSVELNVEQRLSNVRKEQRIRILYSDDDVVVVSKPPNLRSVPGNAQEPTEKKRKRELSVQEAWMEAIRSLQTSGNEPAHLLLQRLTSSTKPGAPIPRNYNKFSNYVHRNKRRLFDKEHIREGLIDDVFRRIEEKQRQLLNLPQRTALHESAVGQLQLLGLGISDNVSRASQSLFAVHRLDCATSGVMVFARSQQAASVLSQSWREGDKVKKSYLAKVKNWPPWSENDKADGIIDLPLSPSEERLKWRVDKEKGKPSKTKWKVLSKEEQSSSVLLHLTPLTGRTHQLRIHCAHVGSGILGDSLYGSGASDNPAPGEQGSLLYLHAYFLSFPHPMTGKTMEFTVRPDWCTESELLAPSK